MNRIQRELADAIPEMISEIGQTVTWSGTAYSAIVSDPDVTVDLEEGGFTPEGSFRVKIPRSAFNNGAGPFPQINDRITFDGDIYKVIGEKNKGESAFVALSIEV